MQHEEGPSRLAEEEHCLPECCTGTVDILDCFLSCGDDGKSCGFNGNGICELILGFEEEFVLQQ